MTQQILTGQESRDDDAPGDDGTREIASGLPYRRLAVANVIFHRTLQTGNRGWVLVDTVLDPPGGRNG